MMVVHVLVLFFLQYPINKVSSECLNNYMFTQESQWEAHPGWSILGYITPDVSETLEDWRLEITFTDKLIKDLQVWNADIDKVRKTQIILKPPMDYNRIILGKQHFQPVGFIATTKTKKDSYLECVQFCGKPVNSEDDICSSTRTSGSTETTTTTTLKPKTTTSTTDTAMTTEQMLTTTPEDKTDDTTTKATMSTTSSTATEPPKCTPKYNYAQVLNLSLLFYEAQRSGKLPPDQRVKWRHDSALRDGIDAGIDLSGGYYDAGDYVKFGFPMASAITNLAWGMIEFKEGYIKSDQLKYGLQSLKWATDYFIKCHSSETVFYGQVGDGDRDHAYWGRPEDMTMPRPSFKIGEANGGSDLAGETAAALAACSIVFKDAKDVDYANTLLERAVLLYAFADKYRAKYSDSIPGAKKFYESYSGYRDELAWALLWLFKATGEDKYKNAYTNTYQNMAFSNQFNEFSWDNKWAGVRVLAASLQLDIRHLDGFATRLRDGKRTPQGLLFVYQWGSNRHAANLAFLALIAAKGDTDKDFYETFARSQIHYMLGDTGMSFVVGFGKKYPLQPHHRSSSCPAKLPCNWNNFNSNSPNKHILYGALVGGPKDEYGTYVDKRSDFITNEVALDYNAGFQSAIAALVELAAGGKC